MPINPINFPTISWEGANPLAAGMQQGAQTQNLFADMITKALQQQRMRELMPFMAPQAQATLDQTSLGNEAQRLKNPFIAPQAQADLEKTQQQVKFEPLKQLREAGKEARVGSRFDNSYQLHQALSSLDPSTRNLWISQHPTEYSSMLNTLAQQSNNGNPYNDAINDLVKKLIPDLNSNNNFNSNNRDITNLPTKNEPIVATNQNNSISNNDQSFQDSFQTSLQHESNRKSVSPQLNARADSAIVNEKWLSTNRDKYSDVLSTVNKYAGWTGSLNKLIDKVKKESPEEYQNLLWYKTAFIPHASNMVKQMEKLASSKNQRDELHDLSNALDRSDLDPKSALNLFNKQISTIQDVTDSILEAAEPKVKGTYRKSYGLNRFDEGYVDSGKKSYKSKAEMKASMSDADLERIARGG